MEGDGMTDEERAAFGVNAKNLIMARRKGDHGGYHPHFKIISNGFELEFPFVRLLAGAVIFGAIGWLLHGMVL